MLKPKSIVIFSVSGLILSFLISIFATHNFGWSILRAFIFAVVFGGLAVGIQFLSSKFLSAGDDGYDVADTARSAASAPSTGNAVDITIGDERLTEDDKGPQFNVASNRMPLGGKTTAPVNEDKDTSAFGFVPVALGSTKVSKEEAASVIDPLAPKREPFRSEAEVPVTPPPVPQSSGSDEAPSEPPESPAPVQSAEQEMAMQNTESAGPAKQLSAKELAAAKKNAEREADRKEIDSLPDIGDDAFGDTDVSSVEIIKDSDFAESGHIESSEDERISLVDGSRAKDHDSETMAKAIRTLLKKDD